MKKIMWGAFGLAVLTAAATAMAVAPIRITAFVPVGLGESESIAADGMAKLRYFVDPVNGPSVEAHVHLYNFCPHTPYKVYIETDKGGGNIPDGGSVTTNGGGNANVTFFVHSLEGEPLSYALVTVWRDTAPVNNEFDADEERAWGFVNLAP